MPSLTSKTTRKRSVPRWLSCVTARLAKLGLSWICSFSSKTRAWYCPFFRVGVKLGILTSVLIGRLKTFEDDDACDVVARAGRVLDDQRSMRNIMRHRGVRLLLYACYCYCYCCLHTGETFVLIARAVEKYTGLRWESGFYLYVLTHQETTTPIGALLYQSIEERTLPLYMLLVLVSGQRHGGTTRPASVELRHPHIWSVYTVVILAASTMRPGMLDCSHITHQSRWRPPWQTHWTSEHRPLPSVCLDTDVGGPYLALRRATSAALITSSIRLLGSSRTRLPLPILNSAST